MSDLLQELMHESCPNFYSKPEQKKAYLERIITLVREDTVRRCIDAMQKERETENQSDESGQDSAAKRTYNYAVDQMIKTLEAQK